MHILKKATGECKWKTQTVTRASAAPVLLLLMLTNGAGLPAVYQRDAEAPASHPSAVFPRHCLHSGRGQTLTGSNVTRNHEFLTHADDAQSVSRGSPPSITPNLLLPSSLHALFFFFFPPYVGSACCQHMAHCTAHRTAISCCHIKSSPFLLLHSEAQGCVGLSC